MKRPIVGSASARLATAVVLAVSTGAACSSPSNVDKNLSTSAPSSGGSGAGATGGGATGGIASGGTSGGAHAGGGGNEGAIDAGAFRCNGSTLTPLNLYPNCDGKAQTICVEVPFNVCFCDGTTAFGFGKPVPIRHLGPCTDAERADADVGVADAGRDSPANSRVDDGTTP